MTAPWQEPSQWLGHRDMCSLQWSDECDCGPEPVDLSEPHCTCADPQPPLGHLVCALHGIDPREPRYLETLDEDERRGH